MAAWLVIALGLHAQVNCPSGFSSSGSCGVSFIGGGGQNFAVVGSNNGSTPALSGSAVNLAPTGAVHTALSLNYAVSAVNVQAFTSTFTFVPNGQNLAFVVQNNTNSSAGGTGHNFSSGAGCEAGFFQAFATGQVNNIFALELDSYSYLNSTPSFAYSSAQIYQVGQSPCNPNDSGPGYWLTNKVSTSPVPLNSPSGTQNTSTGDTYSATVTYDGSNLTLNLYDVTAGGSCPGASCFTHTWSNISIPSLVNGTTAWAGFTEGTGIPSSYPLKINSWTYTANSPTATPGFTAWNAGTTTNPGTVTAASPTYSITPGGYTGTQNVSISTGTPGANICYVLASSTPTILPQTNNTGGCQTGTPYSGPVAIASTQTPAR
jgi:hypothetical protein